MKTLFKKLLKEVEQQGEKEIMADPLGDSIMDYARNAKGYAFSDLTAIYAMLAKLRTYGLEQNSEDKANKGDERN